MRVKNCFSTPARSREANFCNKEMRLSLSLLPTKEQESTLPVVCEN